MTSPAGQTGDLKSALAQAAWHVERDPAKAVELARDVLIGAPGNPRARLYLAAALRRLGQISEARDLLCVLSTEQPDMALVWFELGLIHATKDETQLAIEALSKATALMPDLGEAWSALSAQHALAGNDVAAAAAAAQQMRATFKEPELAAAAQALSANDPRRAETVVREFLRRQPNHVAALRLLAEIGTRLGSYGEVEDLLARCLKLAPDFTAARYNYAVVLHYQHKYEAALNEIERLLLKEPNNPAYLGLKASALGQIGEYAAAVACYELILKDHPKQPKAWTTYGNALQAIGRQADAVAAYRKTLALAPTMSTAWWSLANLKTFRFSPSDVAAMRAMLDRSDGGDDDRVSLHFALGKALEDTQDYAGAFEQYAAGNALQRKRVSYDPEEMATHVRRSRAIFTEEFFAERKDWGDPSPDPIFIVGLPRAGSTLIEQILASHSAVEGTMELPDISRIAWRLGGNKAPGRTSAYPECLARLDAGQIRALGAEYLERTRVYRHLGRPLFIDKDPNNFAHTGLIHLILPNAKIIDARRHPMACCFSAFKQHFPRGQAFTYALADVGRYYVDYLALMAHMDSVLANRVYRVFYERLVETPEREIRRLLDYCGLPFEEACLAFYKNDRPVRTASSEQVRQPIFREGLDQWRHFEPWLGALREALGSATTDYEATLRSFGN